MDKKDILAPLQWRYATKLYDTNKKLSKEDLDTMLEAGRLSPSMSWTQPWHFIVISDQTIKEQLRSNYAKGNLQVKQAPYLIVLCRIINYGPEYIDQIIKDTADIRWVSIDSLEEYREMLTWFVTSSDIWTRSNVYISLGMMVYAAAQLGIDASPMWWFNHKWFDEVLWLREKNLESVVLLAVGYRDKSDPASQVKKVRRPIDKIITYI